MKNTVNIIVIGFRLGKIEEQCLNHIVRNTTYPYIITYYDNYRNDQTLTQLWNTFIGASPTDYICLLNNDTKVTPGWLTHMVHTLETAPDCGFVGPSTDNCHSPQKQINTPELAKQRMNCVMEMKDPISGFCLLFRKALWQELDGFDVRYKHYGQESDLIDRAQQRGYKAYWRQDAFVYHIGEASVKVSTLDADAARTEAKQLYWSTRKK